MQRLVRLLLTLAALMTIALAAAPAMARPIQVVSLDGHMESADKVFLGTVTTEHTLVKSQPGPFGSKVKVVELGVLVDIGFRNAKRGEDVRLRHLVVLPSSEPMINGFGPVELKKQMTYLFFVKAAPAGRFELIAIEDSIVTMNPSAVPPLVKVAKLHAKKKAAARATEVLMHRVGTCKNACPRAIWMLSRVKALTAKTKAAKARRKRFAASLVRVVHASDHDNTLNAAYTELGRLGVTSVLPRIIRIACGDPKKTKRILSNTINWLQGYDDAHQIAALEKIVKRAKDPHVVSYAKRKLKHLKP